MSSDFDTNCGEKFKLYVQGSSKLSSEYEFCKKVPPEQRLFYINYKMNEQGEVEPPFDEEIIETNATNIY